MKNVIEDVFYMISGKFNNNAYVIGVIVNSCFKDVEMSKRTSIPRRIKFLGSIAF